MGTVTAGAFEFVGHSESFGSFLQGFGAAAGVAKSVAHGVVGGVANAVAGGDFVSGFVSAGMTHSFARPISRLPSLAARTATAAIVGGASAQLGGGKFRSGATTVTFLSLFDSAAGYYKRSVGRQANPWPGENREQRPYYDPDSLGRQRIEDTEINVIGFNNELTGHFFKDFGAQGGPVSKVLNVIPTMNATAGLHDYWFNSKQLTFTTFNNVGTMLPAAAISVGATIGNLTQGWQNNPMAWHLLTGPYDKDRRR